MPTSSQVQVMRKVGAQGPARAIVTREAFPKTYVPPARKVFSLGSQPLVIKDLDEPDSEKQFTYFPEMSSLAQLAATPGVNIEEMTADQIITRLQELGWRKEGEAARRMAEREKREQEKQRLKEEARRKQATLDLINDPLLVRVASKSHALPVYSKPPDSRPCAVCFDTNRPAVAHVTVMQHLNTLIDSFDDVVVKAGEKKCLSKK